MQQSGSDQPRPGGGVDPGGRRWSAIVVAGGRASRLGGIDKTALRYRGRSLLQLAVDSVAHAWRVAIVGGTVVGDGMDGVVSATDVVRVTEEPRFGGPAAAIAAGLRALNDPQSPRRAADSDEFTVVLAADLPRVTEALAILAQALDAGHHDADGVIGVDDGGRRQPLLAIYRTTLLQAAVARLSDAGPLEGSSMRQLIATLDLVECAIPGELSRDVDTVADADHHGITLDVPAQFGEHS